MRAVRGFDRPAIQWLFVALACGLVVAGALATLALWRTRGELAALHAERLQARTAVQTLEARVAREAAARESLALELARLRGSAAAVAAPPTLTMLPADTRAAVPPPAAVDAPGAAVAIELRLMLPTGSPMSPGPYHITLRHWSTGEVLWTRADIPPGRVNGRPAAVALITGDLLRPGSYEFLLRTAAVTGAEIASYELSVR